MPVKVQKLVSLLFLSLLGMGIVTQISFASDHEQAWYEQFTPEALPDDSFFLERRIPLNKKREYYLEHLCENVIQPQWKKSENIGGAIEQIESLMGKIGAVYSDQTDILQGTLSYYFKSDIPLSGGNYGGYAVLFSQVLDDENSGGQLDTLYQEKARNIKDKYGLFVGLPSDKPVRVHPEYTKISSQVLRFDFPVYGKYLDQPVNEGEDTPSVLFQEVMNNYPVMAPPYPQWTFLNTERRDTFKYIYVYPVKNLEQQDKDKKFANIVLSFDGKRDEKDGLSDIDLARISCQYLRGQKTTEVGEENKHPRAPEIVQECKAYSKWYSCHYNQTRGFSSICTRRPSYKEVCKEGVE